MGSIFTKKNLITAGLAVLGGRVTSGFATDKTGAMFKIALAFGGALAGVVAAGHIAK